MQNILVWSLHLDFKSKILLEVLDDHHKERKLNAQSFLRVSRTRYVGGTADRTTRRSYPE